MLEICNKSGYSCCQRFFDLDSVRLFFLLFALWLCAFPCEEIKYARYYLSNHDIDSKSLSLPFRCSFQLANISHLYFVECTCRSAENFWQSCRNLGGSADLHMFIEKGDQYEWCRSRGCFNIFMKEPNRCAHYVASVGWYFENCEPGDPLFVWSFEKIESDEALEDACFLHSSTCTIDNQSSTMTYAPERVTTSRNASFYAKATYSSDATEPATTSRNLSTYAKAPCSSNATEPATSSGNVSTYTNATGRNVSTHAKVNRFSDTTELMTASRNVHTYANTTEPVTTSGNVYAHANASESVTTRRNISTNASIDLVNPFATLEQCPTVQCMLQPNDQTIPDECYSGYSENNGRRIPCSPLSRTVQVVAKTMNTFGSMWVSRLWIMSAFLMLSTMPTFLLHQIQCAQDILLGLSHVLVMFYVSRIDNELICQSTAITLVICHCIHMVLLTLECTCVYSCLTNMLNSCNTFRFKLYSCLMTAVFTCSMLAYLICYPVLTPSTFSCWINYDSHIAKSVLTSMGILSSLPMIFAEAGISGLRKPLPSIMKSERIVAQISSVTLIFKIVLSAASVILTSFAMFYQGLEFFPIAFGVNVALGCTIFLANAAGNPRINNILKKARTFVKACIRNNR